MKDSKRLVTCQMGDGPEYGFNHVRYVQVLSVSPEDPEECIVRIKGSEISYIARPTPMYARGVAELVCVGVVS